MTTLAANANVTLTLTAYDSVTIESRGPVLVEAVSGLGVTAGKIAELQGMRTLGPYTAAGSLKLTSYGQPVDYQVADGSNPSSNAQYAYNPDGSVAGLEGPGGKILATGKRQSAISALVPLMPTFDASALVVTHNLMMTAPGHFDAVALVAISIGATTMTIDGAAVAVSERSDTSKTIPIVGGTQYNALAAAGTQKGWLPVTWDGGSTSVAVAAGTVARPTLKLSDWIPLSSVDRVESGKSFPLVMARTYLNNRTYSSFTFSNAAQQDAFGAALAPYEAYHVAQSSVDGVSNPAAVTSVWTAGANTPSVRIFGLAFRMRGSADLILFCGDSIIRGLGAGGDVVTNNAANSAGGWTTLSALALANVSKPVGYINAGIGGQTSAQYLQRAKDFMTLIRPTIAVHPVYTPNDTPTTDAANSAEFSRALDFADTCYAAGTVPVLVAPVPYSGAGTEARRQSVIAKVAAVRGVFHIDPNVAGVYDATNAAGAYWNTAGTVDNTHPSASGYAAAAILAATPVLTTLVE